ncbi:hypothetical protein ACIFOC_00402 [Leucobacter aridicollis]|uniref:hypothetical protein n=1 Tax=Leucobacter aridicollis TaxID=283878 RepID=UPI0037C92706
MTSPTPEQIEAAAKAMSEASSGFFSDGSWRHLAREALVAAAGAAPRGDDLVERIADALAYYQCRETNPKADDPRMGYHSFSEEQRDHLRQQKGEAAAEIARMVTAGFTSSERASHRRLIEELRSAPIEGWAWQSLLDRAANTLAAPVQVDEAKLAEVIWAEQESRVLNGYVIHTRATAATTAAAVASHLRGGQQ